MKSYRYDLIKAALEFSIEEHPQKQMKNLGFNVVKAEPIPIADCWIFVVENDIDYVPKYLQRISDDYSWD